VQKHTVIHSTQSTHPGFDNHNALLPNYAAAHWEVV